MEPVNVYQNVGPGESFLFDVKYVNLEYIFYKIYTFFRWLFGVSGDDSGSGSAFNFGFDWNTGKFSWDLAIAPGSNFALFVEFAKDILYLLIVFFLTIIGYVIVRVLEIRKKEAEYFKAEIERYARLQEEKESHTQTKTVKNPRWEVVIKYVNSDNENDWRLAIIEADSMLDDLLDKLGFRGEGVGEKLKSVNKEDFRGLNFAWEAHAVRNKIAHEGTNFVLTLREAGRVVGLFESIFRDYDYI